MLGGRHRKARVLAQPFEFDERLMIARSERLAHSLVEAHRPSKAGPPARLIRRKFVHDVCRCLRRARLRRAAAQAACRFRNGTRGSRSVDAQLDQPGFLRRGTRLQHRPGAMIESPRIIEPYLDGLEQLAHASGKPRIARRRVTGRRTALAGSRRNRGSFSAFPSRSRGSLVYQCAETHKIALGRGMDSPRARQVSVYLLRSSGSSGCRAKNTTRHSGVGFPPSGAYARSSSSASARSPFSSVISGALVAFSASPVSSGWPFAVSVPRATCK